MPILNYLGKDLMIDITIPIYRSKVMGIVLLKGHVTLEKPDIPLIYSISYLTGSAILLKKDIDPENIDCSVKLIPRNANTIALNYNTIIDGSVSISSSSYTDDIFNNIEVIVPYTINNTDIDSTVTLIPNQYNESDKDILGSCKLDYTLFKKNILTGNLYIDKQKESQEFNGAVSILPEDYEEDLFNIAIRVPRYDVSVYIDTRVIVPKFRVQYTIPIDIQVVPWVCTCFNVDIDVVNECIWDFDGTVELPRIDIEDGIDSTVTLIPEAYIDIDCSVTMNKLATYRQFDCSGFLIGRVINEFDVNITTEECEYPIYEFSEDIMDCVVHFGGKSLFDFDITVKAEAIPKYDFEEDIMDGMVYLRDYKRIGIVVDPRWNYDPYVFKSSLLTLFDKYYDKTVLDIVYGGHPRSDWDIEHLGYVFHNKLTKVPIIYDPMFPEHTKRTIEHYIYHLSDLPPETPLAKVFLFTDRPDYIASNPLSLITQFCKDNYIDFAIITSGGEFIDYHDNQAFSTTTNPLRTEPHSVLGPLSVMPMDHFNRVADPSDPKHPYYHPTKIIY